MKFSTFKYGVSIAALALTMSTGMAQAAEVTITNGQNVSTSGLSPTGDWITYTNGTGPIGFTFESSVTLAEDSGNSIDGSETPASSTTSDVITFTLGDGLNGNGAVTIIAQGSVLADQGGSPDTINFTFDGEDGHTLTLGDGDDAHNLGSAGEIQLANSNDILNLNDDITLGRINFNADANIAVADTVVITGDVDAGSSGVGTVTFAGGGTITGNVGANAALGEIDVNSGNTVTLSGTTIQSSLIDVGSAGIVDLSGASATINVTSTTLDGGATLTFSGANSTYTGAISSGDNSGVVNVDAAGIVIDGVIGGGGNEVATISVANSGSLELRNNANATGISLEGNGQLILNGAGLSITSANGIDGASSNGAILVSQSASIDGDIGGTNGIALLDVDSGTLNFTGAGTTIDATNITVDGVLQISTTGTTTVNGDLASSGGTNGDLNIDSDTNFTGQVGSNGNSLANMSIANGTVVNISSTGSDNYVGTVTLEGAGSLTFSGGNPANKTFTGDIVSDGGGAGVLDVDSSLTLTGNIGTATPGDELVAVVVGASGLVNYEQNGNIFAYQVTIANTSVLTMNTAGTAITTSGGVIGATPNAGNFATGGVAGNISVNGNLGTSSNPLAGIDVATTDDLIVSGTQVNATNITVDGELTLTGNNVVVGGAVDSTGGSAGALDIDNNATFSSSVGGAQSLATMNVADNMSVDLQGSSNQIDAVTLAGANGSTLLFSTSAGSFTGTIDSDGSQAGIIDVDVNTDITGAVGTSQNIAEAQIADGVILSLNNNAVIDDVTLEGTGRLAITGNNVTVTSANGVDSDGTGTGVISIANGVTNAEIAGNVGSSNGVATLSVGTGADLELSGTTIDADTISLVDVTSSLRFSGNGATITSSNGLAGAGSVVFDGGGTQTFTGTLAHTGGIEVSSGTTLDASGTIGAGVITIDDTSTLNLTSASSIAGDINSTNGNTGGSLDIDADTTISGDIGTNDILGSFDVDSNARLTLGANTVRVGAGTVNGTLAVTDTVTLGAGSAIQFEDGSTIALSVGTLATTNVETGNGTYIDADTNDATVTFANNATVSISIASSFQGELDIVDANGGTLSLNGATFTTGQVAATIDSVVTAIEDERITLSVTVKSDERIANELDISTGEADALIAISESLTTGDDAAGRAALDTALLAGGSQAKAAGQQVTADINSFASSTATADVGRANFGNVSGRLNSLRTGRSMAPSSRAGVSSGNGGMDESFWLRGFGQTAEQDERSGVDGFDADTYGVMAGYDTQVTTLSNAGLAFGYANTDVDGKGAGNSQTDIDSYQLTLYADYTPGNYYLEGMVGYAFNDTSVESDINFGGLARTLSGEYETNQYSAGVETGFEYRMSDRVRLIPNAGLQYYHVEGEQVRLSDGAGFTQEVDIDDLNVLLGKVGVRLESEYMAANGGTWMPELRANFLYDFIGDEAEATGTYTATGATYSAEGADVAEAAVNLGVGLSYTSPNSLMEVTAGYDAELKEDFTSHTGLLQARFKF